MRRTSPRRAPRPGVWSAERRPACPRRAPPQPGARPRDEALRRRNAETPRRLEIALRIRLAGGDVVRGDEHGRQRQPGGGEPRRREPASRSSPPPTPPAEASRAQPPPPGTRSRRSVGDSAPSTRSTSAARSAAKPSSRSVSSVRRPCAIAITSSPSRPRSVAQPRQARSTLAAESTSTPSQSNRTPHVDHGSGNGLRDSAGSACADTQSGVVA